MSAKTPMKEGAEGNDDVVDPHGEKEEGSCINNLLCCHHDDGKDDPKGTISMVTTHRCTDIPCLLIFIASLVYLGFVINYSLEKGDMRRLYHGYNFLGELCGLSTAENPNQTDLTEKKFLYYCMKVDAFGMPSLDLEHPVCRPSCPTVNTTDYACYDGMINGVRVPIDAALGAPASFAMTNTYLYKNEKDYQSKAMLGAYCYPTNPVYAEQLTAFISQNPVLKMVMEASSISNAWELLLSAGVVSIILGFIYLKVLEKLAKCLVYTCMAVMCVVPLIIGGSLVYTASGLGGDDNGLDNMPSTGDTTWDYLIGIPLLILGVVFIVLSACACTAITTAIRVIQATSEALMDMPTLLFEPVITQSIRAVVMTMMAVGFLQLVSVGQMSTMTIEEFAVLGAGGLNGVLRSFSYQEDDYYYLAYYVFMIFWVLCLSTALSQFALAYAVQHWYFEPLKNSAGENDEHGSKHIDCCPIFAGYCVGLKKHLGSVAFGSFLIAVLMMVKLVLKFIAKQVSDDGNQAAKAAASCMICCVHCFQKCLEFLNKNAYMDIAVNSSSFCFGAKNALKIILNNLPEIAILNGSCFVFEVAGVGAISGFCTLSAYIAIQNVDFWSNPENEKHISDPLIILIVVGIIGALIGYAFMSVFDMCADTILYCFVIEQKRRDAGFYDGSDEIFTPDSLVELVNYGKAKHQGLEESSGEDSGDN